MHEPPIQFEHNGDTRPLVVWVVVFALLMGLSWLGLQCLFGLCIVQDDGWVGYAALGATAAMLVSEGVFRLIDKVLDR